MTNKEISDWVVAIGAAVSGITSIILVLVAYFQLRGLKVQLGQAASDAIDRNNQEDRRNTLNAIQRAENDPYLQRAYRTIARVTKGTLNYSKTHICKYYVNIILNYYEGIAVGIAQKIYVEAMAKDYLAESLQKAVKIWLRGDTDDDFVPPTAMFAASDFPELRKLYDRWFPPKSTEFRADKPSPAGH
jgi:hypothetical protein